MIIKDMFEKPINRKINGVVRANQMEENVIAQELSEYVVTRELKDHFEEFFEYYNNLLEEPSNDIGVWISGSYGSGKSHFLKILSYLLENRKVNDKNALDYFKEDNKINDESIITNMEKASNSDVEVILFNLISKSKEFEEEDKILDIFVRVFNEHRGYSGKYPYLAELEKNLDSEDKYDIFKDEFESINGDSWVNSRDKFLDKQDEIIEALVNIGYSYESASNRIYKAKENYSITSEEFAKEVNDYCKSIGSDHHVIFLVDEVGQYIARNSRLLIHFQSLVEDLGSTCKDKAWLIATSQEDMETITKDEDADLSKMLGRFKTQLRLSSSSVGEIIKKRLLAKNDDANEILLNEYNEKGSLIENLFTFKDCSDMKTFKKAEDYSSTYPFVPYQFTLLQNVLKSLSEYTKSGTNISKGERSMIQEFQDSLIKEQSGKKLMNEEEGLLVPLNNFYIPIRDYVDSDHKSTISQAAENDNLDDFDIEVLKTLFLIRYVNEIPKNIENITTLMVSSIDENTSDLEERIKDSLERLIQETKIQKDGKEYIFLTDKQQDRYLEIKGEDVHKDEILVNVAVNIFDNILEEKYRYSNRYNYDFRKIVDSLEYKTKGFIGLRLVSSHYSLIDVFEDQITSDELTQEEKRIKSLEELSKKHKDVIVYLDDVDDTFQEIHDTEQIKMSLRKHNSDWDEQIKSGLKHERQIKEDRIKVSLKKYLEESELYVKGEKLNIKDKDPVKKINKALKNLTERVFYNLGYMEKEPKKQDLIIILENRSSKKLPDSQNHSPNAINDLNNYLDQQDDNDAKFSLNDIIKRYKEPPFGFVDKDVEWIVLKLAYDKQITLNYRDKEISFFNESQQNLINYLTKKEYRDQIYIAKKKETSTSKINSAKTILSDVFNKEKIPNDEDILMEETKNEIDQQLVNITVCLQNYNGSIKYPGKKTLKEAESVYRNIKDSQNNKEFYDIISESKENILDFYEELEDVFYLFDSDQKVFFDEAVENITTFDKYKDATDLDDLSDIISNIKAITQKQSPYNDIKDLPDLNKEFENGYDKVLEDEKKVIKSDLDDLYNEVKELINENNNPSKLLDQAEKNYNELLEKLDDCKDISDIQAIQTQAEKRIRKPVIYNLELIEKQNQSKEEKINKPENKPENITQTKSQRNTRQVTIPELMQKDHITLKNDEELSEFLDDLKATIEKALEENEEVDLNFL